jgi:hypothetical protein
MKGVPMKRTTYLWLILATIAVCGRTSSVCAQQSTPRIRFEALPLHVDSVSMMAAAVGATSVNSVPMWNYTTTASRDRNTYSGTIVGRSPFFHGARTTSINTILIPVKISIKDSSNVTTVFDPTQPDANCLPKDTASAVSLTQQSPILMPASFTMNGVDEGTTQYIDAFQRASFNGAVNETGNSYHTLLNLTNTVPVVSVAMNSPSGAVFDGTVDGFCGKVGVVDINAFDPKVLSTVLPSLVAQGVGPTTIPILLFYNVVMTDGPPDQQDPFAGNCCILGYHGGSKVPLQLYSVADYDSSGVFSFDGSGLDVEVLSHEIGELVNDPLVTNNTPSWGDVGQVQGMCQTNLEVGDPLSGTEFPRVTMPNGVNYHLQELAFYSWFFSTPSIGAGGAFSNNGTFTTNAGSICH